MVTNNDTLNKFQSASANCIKSSPKFAPSTIPTRPIKPPIQSKAAMIKVAVNKTTNSKAPTPIITAHDEHAIRDTSPTPSTASSHNTSFDEEEKLFMEASTLYAPTEPPNMSLKPTKPLSYNTTNAIHHHPHLQMKPTVQHMKHSATHEQILVMINNLIVNKFINNNN